MSGIPFIRPHPIECDGDRTHEVSTDILFYAFRYALGRMTYVVGDVVSALQLHWPMIDLKHQTLILKEIEDARQRNALGMPCDVEEWDKIAKLQQGGVNKKT